MCGKATFVIQWPFLLAAFVHDPTSHIADCACGYVGDVIITPNHRANCWVCWFYTYKRLQSEKNVPGVLRLCTPVAVVRGVLCLRMRSCPICRCSPWKLLKISCFLLLNTLRLLAKKCILRFGLTARTSCLQIGRLIDSSANSLKRCNENHMCWNRKCSNHDVCRLS